MAFRCDGERMKILYICPTDPRVTAYGGQQRTHVIWKGLRTVGDVWTIVPVPHKWQEERDEEYRIYKLCLERRYSPGWFAQRLFSRFLPQMAVPWGTALEPIRRLGASFDVVVMRYLRMAGLTRAWKIAPLFVDVDDTPTVEYTLAHPTHRFRQWLLRKWQNRLCARSKLLWVPDPEQINDLKPFKAAHLPNIPVGDISPVDRSRADPNRLLFLGYLAHRPNIVALDWFLEKFWEELKLRFPNLQLDVVGGGLPEEYKIKWSSYSDVTLHGFVQDVVPFFERSLALVTPMKIGSGTCIKVLESLARGTPVISTEQGLRGVDKAYRVAKNGIYSFNTLAGIEDCIANLRKKPFPSVARGFLSACYSQDNITNTLISGMKSAS